MGIDVLLHVCHTRLRAENTEAGHTTMKATALRKMQAQRATAKAQAAQPEQVLTWCFPCEQPQPHTVTIMPVSYGFLGQRVCNVCGTNKDAAK